MGLNQHRKELNERKNSSAGIFVFFSKGKNAGKVMAVSAYLTSFVFFLLMIKQ